MRVEGRGGSRMKDGKCDKQIIPLSLKKVAFHLWSI